MVPLPAMRSKGRAGPVAPMFGSPKSIGNDANETAWHLLAASRDESTREASSADVPSVVPFAASLGSAESWAPNGAPVPDSSELEHAPKAAASATSAGQERQEAGNIICESTFGDAKASSTA